MPFSRYAAVTDRDFWPRPDGERQTPHSVFAAGPLARSLSAERLASLLSTDTGAVENAPAAQGSYPVILLGQGLYYESPITHAILCEYLASHGYVVATCPLIGNGSRLVNLDVIDLEAQIRDLEFVIAHTRQLPSASRERLGLVGFDMGGMSSVVLAMRNPDVDAFVSLDAGILYGHPSELPGASPHYDPARLAIPWMHMTRTEAVPTPEARGSLFETAVHAERFLVLVDGAEHVNFTSFALIEGRAHVPNYWGSSTGRCRSHYQAVCHYVLSFFDAFLRNDDKAREVLARDPAKSTPRIPLTIQHRSAEPAPPTIDDFVNAVAERGIDAAGKMARSLVKSCPDCSLVREDTLNRLGYKYLLFWGETEPALGIFQLNVELHPGSANAYDSLGEAYLIKGETKLAITNYRRSLELDPTNENAKAVLRRLDGS